VAATSVPSDGDLGLSASPLRLVKLRLSLLLLAMAILPLAIAAPLAYTILDGQHSAEQLRAERDSTALASSVAGRLDRIQESVARTAASGAMIGFAGSPQRTGTPAARGLLQALDTGPDDGIGDLIVQGTDGSVRLWMSGGRVLTGRPRITPDDVLASTLALDGFGTYLSSAHPDAAGAPAITVAAPVPGPPGADPAAIVRVEVSLAEMLDAAASSLVDDGTVRARLVSSTGAVMTEAHGGRPGTQVDGTLATAPIPGFGDWRIQVGEHHQLPQTSYALFGGLALLVLTMLALIVWMARQVVRPAEELEASRGRLQSMYETARMDGLQDLLTGLGNHRAFQEEVDRQLDLARRYSTPLSLVLIDLDDFKQVNDTSGHAAGDNLLAEMGRLTQVTIRSTDRAFRIGGDEFAILMPHTDAEGARVVGRRLLASALETRPGSSLATSFSFSVGISSFPAMAVDRRQLSAQADSALYWAKAHGRTMVQVFDPARHRNLGADQAGPDLSASVADLAAKRNLRAVYQPIVELRSGRVLGYEALARPAPDSGFANAGELFAAAEACGRQTELDQTCLEVVIAGAAGLSSESILSLNVSPRTLEAPEFNVVGLIRLLERYGITPNRVILELTERATVDDLGRLRHNVAAARAAGLRIAADDVGAGNAGLRLLSQMQFDIVKIDLSLVQGGPQQETSLAVLSSLNELAQRWGAWVIAEGVETPEQLELIRNLGISAAQGYLLGRPGQALDVGSVDLDALLAKEDWLHALARTGDALAVGASPA
jgi:diguanylate cyclase (GGDEF)-like protein